MGSEIKRICILSMTAVRDDPRPTREAQTLTDLGYDVVSVGLRSTRTVEDHATRGRYVELDEASGTLKRFGTVLRAILGSALPRLATTVFWSSAVNRSFYRELVAVRPDLVIAHDWYVLPIAGRFRRKYGVSFVYESHEYFPEHRMDSAVWRLMFRRYVVAVERRHIFGATSVITVSKGIAEAMKEFYGLVTIPNVIRSMPTMDNIGDLDTAERTNIEADDSIEVLYHGVFNPARRLDSLIRSVPLWDDRLTLVLRGGFGPPGYEQKLRALVAEFDLADKVRFDEPVAATRLVSAARRSDIGVSLLGGESTQERYALPNKLFEYVMAGLAVLVLEGTESARLIDELGCGLSIRDATPTAIAEALNGVDSEDLTHWKTASVNARRSVSWEGERAILTEVIEGIVGPSTGVDSHT